jgi:hypothetical protein
MKNSVLLLIAFFLTNASYAQEWTQLFNGKDLTGWEQIGPGKFVVEDGKLKTVGGMGMLLFAGEKFGDVQIRVVYDVANGHDNSGIFIRIPDKPADPWEAVNRGFEIQIDNGMRFLHDDYHCTGVLYSFSKALSYPQFRPGKWNTMEISLIGPKTVVYVNGEKVTEFKEGDPVPPEGRWFEPKRGQRPDSGYIGLQNHDDESTVYFREVAIRSLK